MAIRILQNSRRVRVILVNTYPMDEAYTLWRDGTYPGHHLWGAIELEYKHNIEVIILKHEKYKWLNKIGCWFRIQFLDQQLRAIWALRDADLLYAPYGSINTKLIVLLKWIGLVKKPIVVLVHLKMFSFRGNTLATMIKRCMVNQYDAMGFLSTRLMQELIRDLKCNGHNQKFYAVNWGVELAFYEKALKPNEPENYGVFVSIGSTNRDYETLVKAFRVLKLPLRIWVGASPVARDEDLPENIRVVRTWVGYKELLKEYAEAKIILIPLLETSADTTQGLTSLYDALAMGKPVIMSRNPNVDLDIEKEEIGRWVRIGNVDDWVAAVNELCSDPALLKKMGENSRKLARTRFNTDVFARDLFQIFNSVMKKQNEIS